MFAASPGLHAVEHPVYDVWLTDCRQTSTVPPPEGYAGPPVQIVQEGADTLGAGAPVAPDAAAAPLDAVAVPVPRPKPPLF
jgi:hypothetical protein